MFQNVLVFIKYLIYETNLSTGEGQKFEGLVEM